MCVYVCVCFLLTLAKHYFLFLSAFASATPHLYCFPPVEPRDPGLVPSWAASHSPLSSLLLSRPSAQLLWSDMEKRPWLRHTDRDERIEASVQTCRDLRLNWKGTGAGHGRCSGHLCLASSSCSHSQTRSTRHRTEGCLAALSFICLAGSALPVPPSSLNDDVPHRKFNVAASDLLIQQH